MNTSAAPRAMLIMPSVTMNGGSPPQLIERAVDQPAGDARRQRQRQRDRQRLAALQRRAEHDARQARRSSRPTDRCRRR